MLQQVLSTPVTPDYRLEYTVEDRYFDFDTGASNSSWAMCRCIPPT